MTLWRCQRAFGAIALIALGAGLAACRSRSSNSGASDAAAPVTSIPPPAGPGVSRTPLEAMSGDDPGRCVKDVIVDGTSICFEFNRDYYWCRGGGRAQSIMLDSGTAAQDRRRNSDKPYNVIPYHFSRLYLTSDRGCGSDELHGLSCWGYNSGGLPGERGLIAEPVRMAHLPTHFDDFALSTFNYCARASDAITCSRNNSQALEPVTGLGKDLRWMGAGSSIWCAANDREVWCWAQGMSWAYAPRDAEQKARQARPISLPEGLRIRSLQVGSDHACVLNESGGVYCFGQALYGAWGTGERPSCDSQQLPEGCSETRKAHFVDTLGTNVKQLALNGIVSCALKTDGSVWCWGDNQTHVISASEAVIEERGQKLNLEPLPQQRAELGFDNQRILAGEGHACVEKKDGALWCWGGNDGGQFGGARLKFIPPTRLELPAPRCNEP